MDDPKLVSFGQWLTAQTIQLRAELLSTCANDKMPIETVKRKYGQFEAFDTCLKTFTELYEGDLDKFRKDYLNEGENVED